MFHWTLSTFGHATLIHSSLSLSLSSQSKCHCDWRSISESVSLDVLPHLGLMSRYLIVFDSYGLVYVGGPFWQKDGSAFCTYAAGSHQRSLSRVRVPWDSRPYFTVTRFETSHFVASYDSQGHGGGIRARLHTDVSGFLVIYPRVGKVKINYSLCLTNYALRHEFVWGVDV
jgi:hypothetical protein